MKTAERPSAAPHAVLGEEIAKALSDAGLVPVEALPMSALSTAGSRKATFRIALADGRLLKVRRVARPGKVWRAARLVRALAHPQVTQMRCLANRIAVEEWVEGAPLSALALDEQRVHGAADLLAALHATASIGEQAVLDSRRTHALRRRAERQLRGLKDASLVTAAEGAALIRILRERDPQEAVFGLIHNDFCGENIIEQSDGRLVAIDNEGVRLSFLDFDLARTWYRWDLPEPHWARFASRYARHGRVPPGEPTIFWRIAAVLKSAHVRLVAGSPDIDVPLKKLRQLVSSA